MSDDTWDQGQSITRKTYEDRGLVQAFLVRNGAGDNTALIPEHIKAFAASLKGSRLIDVGCGPGIDSRRFARLGLQVTGIDYSTAMIETASDLSESGNPTYIRLDMREIGALPASSFDGAWVSASLIHVPEIDVPKVLSGIRDVLAPNGRVRITLKAGPQGPQLVQDDKYGIPIHREFVFWERQNFVPFLEAAGFAIDEVETYEGGVTGTSPTRWLMFGARTVMR